MPFGWGIVSTGKHPDIKIAPAMAAADGGELVGVYSRDQHRAEAFAQKHDARAAYSQLVRPPQGLACRRRLRVLAERLACRARRPGGGSR